LKEKKVPTILLQANSQQFGDGDAYPYKAQVNLIETYYGMVFQNIIFHNKSLKIYLVKQCKINYFFHANLVVALMDFVFIFFNT
jgi:amino acid permease